MTGRYLPPYLNDRRRRKERRQFSYTIHMPERRAGKERRLGSERRRTSRQIITIPQTVDKSIDKDTF